MIESFNIPLEQVAKWVFFPPTLPSSPHVKSLPINQLLNIKGRHYVCGILIIPMPHEFLLAKTIRSLRTQNCRFDLTDLRNAVDVVLRILNLAILGHRGEVLVGSE